ncbi:hypothetical protein F4804DRAFT_348598 [Jackrogersella minutella]|nr:hypothetical protein F4804DRAFT_348598 [Jackrogersella minutella]
MSRSKFAIRLCNVRRKDEKSVTVDDIRMALRVTLAPQETNNLVATISFPSRGKLNVTFSREVKTLNSLPIEWENSDSSFLGMTVIHEPKDTDLDICAVHGLNGNAFDTWYSEESRTMWLRDLLPKIETFRTSRIMIFGYSAVLLGKGNVTDRDYADSLLMQLKRIRGGLRSRPLIIVCHSMGGLVSRLAMSRFQSLPRTFADVPIVLDQCGLLFLSTPYYGTEFSGLHRFWSRLVQVVVNVQIDLTILDYLDNLETFNLSMSEVMKTWNEMDITPAVRCLCEADKTAVFRSGPDIEVVSLPSAGFLNHAAEKVPRTNHHTICKFSSSTENSFRTVEERLGDIKKELLRRLRREQFANKDTVEVEQLGDASLEPSKTPLPSHRRHFYLGHQELRSPSQLVGRADVIREIDDALLNPQETVLRRRFVCLPGAGGIGKTEIAYEVARRHKDHQNVFLLHASDPKQLQDSYIGLSFKIGHDSLLHRYTKYQEAHKIWESLDPASRIEAIKQWLDCEENADAIFIFDDIDGLGDLSMIQKSLPSMSKCLVFSTRDPTLSETPELKAVPVLVPRLTEQESQILIRRGLGEGIAITDQQVQRIAAISCNHPATMLALAHYIRHKPKLLCSDSHPTVAHGVISLLDDRDWETRSEVLNLGISNSLSLLQLYERSLDRLPAKLRPEITEFLAAIAFISPPLGSSSRTSIVQLFRSRPWLAAQMNSVSIPDHQLLGSSLGKKEEIFRAVKRVSLLDDSPTNDGSYIHPIWLECARHRCKRHERITWLRQLLLICFLDADKDGLEVTSELYLDNIRTHIRVSDFAFEDLGLGSSIQAWLHQKGATA